MPVLYRASFGYLLRHPWQLGLALVGISIGVAVIVAVDLANDSSRRAFLLSMEAQNGAATHQLIGGPAGVPEGVYADLRRSGLRSAAPVVQGTAEAGGLSLTVLGVDPFAERDFRDYTLAGRGEPSVLDSRRARTSGPGGDALRRLLVEPGAVLLSAATARRLGVGVDGRFELVAAGRRQAAVVAGLVDDAPAGLDGLLIADIATAQAWFERIGFLSRIDLRLDEAGAERLRASLAPGLELIASEQRTRTTGEMSAAFLTNLSAMSLLALLVGVFLIYNSVAFAVLQRRSLIGILRALGVTRREVAGLILAEAAALGVAGALLGLVAGIGLGRELLALVSQSINDLYFQLDVTGVSVRGLSLAKGAAAGLLATAVAAAGPAFEASGYRPQLALRRSVLEHRSGRLPPWLAAAGLGAAALSALLIGLSGRSLPAGLVALFLMILGFALCIPLAVRALARRGAPVAARLGGIPARLAVAGIGTALSRTGVAIVALAVAVSATVGVGVMVQSFRGSVVEWLEDTLRSDLYVGVANGSLDPGLVSDITALPGVADWSSSRRAWLETPAGRTRLIVVRSAARSAGATRLLDGDPAVAWPAFEHDGAILVSEPYAYRHGTRPGDRIELATDRGAVPFRVAGTFRSYDANPGSILMSRQTYDRYWRDPAVDSLGLYVADGSDPDRLADAIAALARDRQAVQLRRHRELLAASLRIFDRTFVITDVLYWIAVGVAVVGILGAMLALQLERARELAILRALGMTPAQLAAMVTLQSGLIGLLSGLAALPLGLLMARLLIEVINRRAFGWTMAVRVDGTTLAAALALAVGSALVAGAYPALRAARSRPARAMREE